MLLKGCCTPLFLAPQFLYVGSYYGSFIVKDNELYFCHSVYL